MTVRQFGACLAAGWMTLRSLVTARGADAPEQGMDSMKALVRNRFPTVRQLSVPQLVTWLGQTNRPKPLLVDVRTEAEFHTSHLPGARRLDPGARNLPAEWQVRPETPVVFYCSVGYRSSQQAERAARSGWTNTYNLEGSIFEWANAGHPVEADGKPVHRVHPYNATFGKLLRPDLLPSEKKSSSTTDGRR